MEDKWKNVEKAREAIENLDPVKVPSGALVRFTSHGTVQVEIGDTIYSFSIQYIDAINVE